MASTVNGEFRFIKIISDGSTLSVKNAPTLASIPALNESNLSSKSSTDVSELASAESAPLTSQVANISGALPPLPSSQPAAEKSEPSLASRPSRAAASKKKEQKEPKEPKEAKNPKKKRKKSKTVTRKEVSTTSGPANEITRAINKKAKKSDLLMADRSFNLGTPLGTLGSHEYFADVTARRPDGKAPNIVLKRGLKVKLLNREDLVRIYCAYVSVNGSQAKLFVRGDEEEGAPQPVSVLDVESIPEGQQDLPAGFEERVSTFLEDRRKGMEAKAEEAKKTRTEALKKKRFHFGEVKKEPGTYTTSSSPSPVVANQDLLQEYRKRVEVLESRVKELEQLVEKKNDELKAAMAAHSEKLFDLLTRK